MAANQLVAEVPKDVGKDCVCCLSCRLVKSFDQFVENGCENCPELKLDEGSDRVAEFTTSTFVGMMAVVDPKKSWTAKWHRLSRAVPGIYAVKVPDSVYEGLNEEVREELEQAKNP